MADFRPKQYYYDSREIQTAAKVTATASERWSSSSQDVARAADLRCYSAHYASNYSFSLPPPPPAPPAQKVEKEKTSRSGSLRSWSFNDPEFQRKRRVASYKAYTVEGKVKGSFRRSLRWIKNRYTQVLYGWW